jgi:hypothetical protein
MKQQVSILVLLLVVMAVSISQADGYPPCGMTTGNPSSIKTESETLPMYTDDWPVVGSVYVDITSPTGLTFDGSYFWITNYTTTSASCIYKVDPETGAIADIIPSPDNWPCAITWDGQNLWVIDFVIGHATYDSLSLCKIDTSGNILEMLYVEYTYYSGGMGWDGTYLYYGVQTEWATPCLCRVHKFDPATGAHISSFDMPSTHIHGLTYYDSYLWWSDDVALELYKMTTSGTIMDQSPAPGPEPAGMAMEGINLCSVDNTNTTIYKMQVGVPDLDVTLTPHNPPITIPATGGSFQYDLTIENTTTDPIVADVWIEALPPGGALIPLIIRTGITFPASTTISRLDITQNVPAGAPPGIYSYICSVGEIFVSVTDYDQFTFEKLATDGGSGQINDWGMSGWEEDEVSLEYQPTGFTLHSSYPNPFNPATTLSFSLAEAGLVSLRVYDVTGREVAVLVNGFRDAGVHEVTFDASQLASGIYIHHFEAGLITTSNKMILIK